MNLADYIAGCARTARQVQIEQAAAPRPLREAISTRELARLLGLTSRQVWGLLKQPRMVGKVEIVAGCWMRSSAWEERRAARAELQAHAGNLKVEGRDACGASLSHAGLAGD